MNIVGVRLIAHSVSPDHRGSLSIISKATSDQGSFDQWNLVRSRAGTLRGMHAHLGYDELYIPVSGRMFISLKDARSHSTTFGEEAWFWSDEYAGNSLLVPTGVAHAVYFETEGVLLYGLSSLWTGQHEYGCRFDDPDIRSPWPYATPTLSDKDKTAGSFSEMAAALSAADIGHSG